MYHVLRGPPDFFSVYVVDTLARYGRLLAVSIHWDLPWLLHHFMICGPMARIFINLSLLRFSPGSASCYWILHIYVSHSILLSTLRVMLHAQSRYAMSRFRISITVLLTGDNWSSFFFLTRHSGVSVLVTAYLSILPKSKG